MSFFYHMSSLKLLGPRKIPQMGTLTVEVKTVDKTWFAVFHKGGDQGDTWHQGHVDLSVSLWHFIMSGITFMLQYVSPSKNTFPPKPLQSWDFCFSILFSDCNIGGDLYKTDTHGQSDWSLCYSCRES